MRRFIGHAVTIAGGLLALGAVLFVEWFRVVPLDVSVTGVDLMLGRVALAIAALALAGTGAAFVLRRRRVAVSHVASALVLAGLALFALIDPVGVVGAGPMYTVKAGAGAGLLLLGAGLLLVGGVLVLWGPSLLPASLWPVRVAVLWRGRILKERLIEEPGSVTVGSDAKATFAVPEECALGARFPLIAFSGGHFHVNLESGVDGTAQLGGEKASVAAHRARLGEQVPLGADDWGLLHAGPLGIFFQSVRPVVRTAAPPVLDSNMMAAAAVSALLHLSLVVVTLFAWDVQETLERRTLSFASMDVQAMYEMDEEEEEEPEEETDEPPLDEARPAAPDEEGKFGIEEVDPMVESEVPSMDGVKVDRLDPRKVGLVGMLSSPQLGGIGAIAHIMNSNTGGLTDKMAVAMAGADTSFVVGHGTGLGFRGTGTGGGRDGTFGVLRGLSDADGLRNGRAFRTQMRPKDPKRVTRVHVSSGRSTGGCRPADIKQRVRRRASVFRACYERRLTVSPNLRGKLTARWTIGVEGRVSRASVVGGTLGDDTVAQCVLRAIRRIRFSKPEGGLCVVQWPFVFSTGRM